MREVCFFLKGKSFLLLQKSKLVSVAASCHILACPGEISYTVSFFTWRVFVTAVYSLDFTLYTSCRLWCAYSVFNSQRCYSDTTSNGKLFYNVTLNMYRYECPSLTCSHYVHYVHCSEHYCQTLQIQALSTDFWIQQCRCIDGHILIRVFCGHISACQLQRRLVKGPTWGHMYVAWGQPIYTVAHTSGEIPLWWCWAPECLACDE